MMAFLYMLSLTQSAETQTFEESICCSPRRIEAPETKNERLRIISWKRLMETGTKTLLWWSHLVETLALFFFLSCEIRNDS
jgi:hypothetical protein